ncbi:MAG TPA: alcohol dehydrogenase catalytic domain-containing protein [Novosphingobium sp.]|nr:alcohol dehydrogenase catalytic domain-containing protein [Novosphingobium sp.]
MRAAVFKGAGQPWAIESLPDPQPGAGEVVIKVCRCGLCGTDLHMTSGSGWDFPAETVPGHEYAGEVVALGAGVEHLAIGDRITALPAKGCGQCAACRAGQVMLCPQMQGYMGGFGEYLRAPAAHAVKLPATLSFADGALIEPLAVGLHGVAMAPLVPGSRVLVLGAGSVALAAIYWARRLGAGRIAVMSRSARRADLAGQLGGDAFIPYGEGEHGEVIAALGGQPDIVLECAGAVGMLGKAVEHARPNGTIVSMGFCTHPDPVIPGIATYKQLRLVFSMAYTLAEFEHVARTLDRGHLEPRLMVSETIPLDALPAMIEGLRAGASQTKVQVAL